MARKKAKVEAVAEVAPPEPVESDESYEASEALQPQVTPRARISGDELAGVLRQQRREQRLAEKGY